MIRFVVGCTLLFFVGFGLTVYAQREPVHQFDISIPAKYMPGEYLPGDASCDWMAAMNYAAYCDAYSNHDISFSYDPLRHVITQTSLWVYYDNIRIGDLINQLGAPTGIRIAGVSHYVYWGTRYAYVSTKWLTPTSHVSYIAYTTDTHNVTRWRGFSNGLAVP